MLRGGFRKPLSLPRHPFFLYLRPIEVLRPIEYLRPIRQRPRKFCPAIFAALPLHTALSATNGAGNADGIFAQGEQGQDAVAEISSISTTHRCPK